MYGPPDSDSEGSDPVAVTTSVNPSPSSQIQAGYNSFGRPSMFAQQSSYNPANNQHSRGDENSSDDSDDDGNNVAASRPAPRGKELRLSGVSLPDADSSDDEDNEPTKAEVTTIAPNPPPRGKVLKLPPKGDDDSSGDDEPLASLKPANGSRKRKDAPNAGDSDSDDDDDVVAATVVEGGDANDVMAVAKVITSNKKVKTNDGKAKKASTAKKSPGKKKSPAVKKGAKSTKTKAPDGFPSVSADKAEASQKARAKLRKNVTSLPFVVSENQIIRSFGQIKPEFGNQLDETQYSSPSSIHPVGFSCDRFMFSPVHNRIITLRCDILEGDGTKIDTNIEPSLVDEDNSSPSKKPSNGGPIFRIIWGEGIEQDDPMDSCPFDSNIGSEYTETSKKKKPEVGMRVNVNINNFNTLGGVITKAKAPAKSGKNKGLSMITIKYDDGVTEDTPFPDPDIQLAPPGKFAFLIVTRTFLYFVLYLIHQCFVNYHRLSTNRYREWHAD